MRQTATDSVLTLLLTGLINKQELLSCL